MKVSEVVVWPLPLPMASEPDKFQRVAEALARPCFDQFKGQCRSCDCGNDKLITH